MNHVSPCCINPPGFSMTTSDHLADEPLLFAATLHPYRSLGWNGFIAVMLAVGAVNLVGAIVFAAVGAWPVLPFLGLDVLLIFLAFRANYRAANAYEEVRITPSLILVRHVAQNGQTREWQFNPLWTRLERERDEEDGTILRMTLVQGRRSVDLASKMPPPERAGFADALLRAIITAKRGPDLSS